MKKIQFLIAALVLIFSTHIFPQESFFFGESQFVDPLYGAIATVKTTSPVELAGGKKLEGVTEVETVKTDATNGSWSVTLTGYYDWDDGIIEVNYGKAIIMNYGEKLVYSFFSPDLRPRFFDRVVAEISGLKEDMMEEYDDVKVEWSRLENKINITAEYSYSNGVDPDDIEERLEFLMFSSRALMNQYLPEQEEIMQDYREEIWDDTFTYLPKEDLLLIILQDLDKFERESDTAKEGYFVYKRSETYNYQNANYGDSLEFRMWVDVVDYTTAEENEEVVKKFQEYVYDEDKPFKASKVFCGWYPGYEGKTILVEATYRFDGTITYGEFFDAYNEAKFDYMQQMHAELMSLFEEYDEWF